MCWAGRSTLGGDVMAKDQRATISVEPVDVRTLTGDVLVVPTATVGHAGPPWDELFWDIVWPAPTVAVSRGEPVFVSATAYREDNRFACVVMLAAQSGSAHP